MPNNKYDHNVDIKSTQIANGLKGIGVGALSLLSAGVVLFLGGATVLFIQGIYEYNQDQKAKKQPINITPFSTMRTIVNDYENNPTRYRLEWEGKYVTHIGKVTEIERFTFDISTQISKGKVICDWDFDDEERVAKLNSGDTISVIGKLNVREIWGRHEFKISSCEIP